MVDLALVLHSGDFDPGFSFPDYEAYRDHLHSFTGVIAQSVDRLVLSDTGGLRTGRGVSSRSFLWKLGLLPTSSSAAEFADTLIVSNNYFSVLGIAPVRGRTFESMTATELNVSPSVLISENYWQKRFAKDPAVLGKTIRLNGAAVTIAGITPHNFVGTGIGAPDFWLPLSLEPLVHADEHWLRDRENRRYRLFGRLASGATISRAQAEMNILAGHLRTLHVAHSESAESGTVLVWRGSPFPLPLKFYGD